MKINSELLDLGLLNINLPLLKKMQVSISTTMEEMRSLEKAFDLKLDVDVRFNSLLTQESSQCLHKQILKEMACSEDFLDVVSLSQSDAIQKLYNYLKVNNFDFIICSSQLGMFAEESLLFQHQIVADNSLKMTMSNTFYKLGELGGIPVYIDAYKKWSDNEIICGRKGSFIYNYKVDEPKLSCNQTLAPKMISQLNYEISVNKNNFINLHYVNEYNAKYVQINRDRKIDEIL